MSVRARNDGNSSLPANAATPSIECALRLQHAQSNPNVDNPASTALPNSPAPITPIRRDCGRGFLIVTPGVRLRGGTWEDQKRVMTPEAAVSGPSPVWSTHGASSP